MDQNETSVPQYFGKEKFYYNRLRTGTITTIKSNHYHNAVEIYWLIAGCCNYFIKNKVYAIHQNDLVFIPKGIIHKTHYLTQHHERIVLNFALDFINPAPIPYTNQLFCRRIYSIPEESQRFVHTIFTKIENEYQLKSDVSETLIQCYISELVVYLSRHPSNASSPFYPNNVIDDITSYINANFAEPITLTFLAEQAKMHSTYFSKKFKDHTGFGFKEYLLTVRMKHAETLLVSSKQTICEIAFSCGFNDSNYFSTIFTKWHGETPSHYRKRIQRREE